MGSRLQILLLMSDLYLILNSFLKYFLIALIAPLLSTSSLCEELYKSRLLWDLITLASFEARLVGVPKVSPTVAVGFINFSPLYLKSTPTSTKGCSLKLIEFSEFESSSSIESFTLDFEIIEKSKYVSLFEGVLNRTSIFIHVRSSKSIWA